MISFENDKLMMELKFYHSKVLEGIESKSYLKGATGKFFGIHLTHIKLFYDVYLLSLIAKLTVRIIFLGG